MNQRFEHCRLTGSRIVYLGRDGLFEDRSDRTGSEFAAWDFLEKEGWELVTATIDKNGATTFYFKRPFKVVKG